MQDELRYIFENVNNWLKFAEAKNAAVVAFNGAITMGALSLLKGYSPPLPIWYLWIVVVSVALSTICALLSFYPQTEIRWWWKTGTPSSEDNLYFYGHISKYSSEHYLQTLFAALPNGIEKNNTVGCSPQAFSRIEMNIAEQIVINAEIASRKYAFFKVALWFLMSALLLPPVAMFVLWFFTRMSKKR